MAPSSSSSPSKSHVLSLHQALYFTPVSQNRRRNTYLKLVLFCLFSDKRKPTYHFKSKYYFSLFWYNFISFYTLADSGMRRRGPPRRKIQKQSNTKQQRWFFRHSKPPQAHSNASPPHRKTQKQKTTQGRQRRPRRLRLLQQLSAPPFSPRKILRRATRNPQQPFLHH